MAPIDFFTVRWMAGLLAGGIVGATVYLIASELPAGVSRRRAAPPPVPTDLEPETVPAARGRVAVVHVAVWAYDQAMDRMTPEQVADTLEDLHRVGQGMVRAMGGTYERNTGSSFSGYWPTEAPEHPQARAAVSCAVSLREEIVRWNRLRATDGAAPLTVTLGADWGVAVVGSFGGAIGFVGEGVGRARSLSQLTVPLGTDLLVSDELWALLDGAFEGSRVAEASLSAVSGLTSCYQVTCYRDADGAMVRLSPTETVASVLQAQAAEQAGAPQRPADQPALHGRVESHRWMVNNGSRILGPFEPAAIAQRLFSQELDFDCECWTEGKGDRTTIAKSGMFGGGSELDPAARFWVYDGVTIHGPLTAGFLNTGLTVRAFGESPFVCEGSTLNAWKSPDPLTTPASGDEVTGDIGVPAGEGTAASGGSRDEAA